MGLSLPAPVWKKPIMHQNDASALSPSFFVVGQFFLYLTFPLLLRLAVYFEYVFLSMPSKWTLQIAPGTKFLRHLGSQCARAHPEKSRKIKKNKIQEENQKCDCQTILYGAIPSKYIDWLIDWLRSISTLLTPFDHFQNGVFGRLISWHHLRPCPNI